MLRCSLRTACVLGVLPRGSEYAPCRSGRSARATHCPWLRLVCLWVRVLRLRLPASLPPSLPRSAFIRKDLWCGSYLRTAAAIDRNSKERITWRSSSCPPHPRAVPCGPAPPVWGPYALWLGVRALRPRTRAQQHPPLLAGVASVCAPVISGRLVGACGGSLHGLRLFLGCPAGAHSQSRTQPQNKPPTPLHFGSCPQ